MTVLWSGTVVNRETNEEQEAILTELNLSHLPEILVLQENIRGNFKGIDPGIWVDLSKDELNGLLGGQGRGIGLWVKKDLVGFFTVVFPGAREDNLGHDLGFAQEDLALVLHLEIALIKSVYRQNGMQYLMMRTLLAKMEEDQVAPFRYLMATIHPLNIASAVSVFKLGLHVVKLTEKYGGNIRHVFYSDRQKKPNWNKSTEIAVELDNYREQLNLLNRGYRGIGIAKDMETNRLIMVSEQKDWEGKRA